MVQTDPIKIETIKVAVARIATVKYFPSDDATKAAVGELLGKLCWKPQAESGLPLVAPDCKECGGAGWITVELERGYSGVRRCVCVRIKLGCTWTPEQQVEWLSERFIQLRIPWVDGLSELRAVYCSKFTPPDGIQAISSNYEEGIPPERPQEPLRLTAAPPKRLGAPETSADQANRELVARTIQAAKMPRHDPDPPPAPRSYIVEDNRTRADKIKERRADIRMMLSLGEIEGARGLLERYPELAPEFGELVHTQ